MSVIDFTLTLSLCKGKLSLTLSGCPEAALSPVINLEVSVMSKTATITFKLPITRVDGTAATMDDVAYADVLLSSDDGVTFTSVGHLIPTISDDLVQTFIQPELEDGDYRAQIIMVDKQTPPVLSAPISVPFIVSSTPVGLAALSPATDLAVTLS